MLNRSRSMTMAVSVLAALTLSYAYAQSKWQDDAPGRVHRIDVAKLPAPFATESARQFPRVTPKPDSAKLQLPPGFKVDVFTRDIEGPRVMRIAPNGDIFVAEEKSGRVKVLHPSADGASVASAAIFVSGLTQPFGIQFYPAGAQPQWVYISEINRVMRYPYKVGDTKPSGQAETVVAQLAGTVGGHSTRDLVFSPDGKKMFVAVGSASNVAEGGPKKSPAEIKTWEAEHGLGAAWGDETNRADVLVFDVGSSKPGKPFATGIRNCVGLAVQPGTGDLWCTVNERDALGDNLVPDYSTRVRENGFYGWPWYYMGDHEDPRHAGERPDLKGKTITPDVPYEAHSAAVGFAFYTATSGKSAFPAEYVGDAFAVFHGSWNRADRTGHKVVRVPMKNGVPTGEYVDFLTGFVTADSQPWGRPASVTVAGDGALLLSDDDANVIYRISYSR
ncbi:MAG: PQQ-dependent sugar dehydrogenase [Gammaproteobacteria bacterium]